MQPVTLETERLMLRPWVESDLGPFATLNADPRVMEFMPECVSRARSDAMVRRIRGHFERFGYGLWAVEIPRASPFIGFIGLQWVRTELPFAPAVEVGYRLSVEHWGHGYATEGARAAVTFARETLRLDEVVSFTARLNIGSQRVMQKVGLVRDPEGDFDHPALPEGHRLRPHLLYRSRRG